jgi:hypothetical protein
MNEIDIAILRREPDGWRKRDLLGKVLRLGDQHQAFANTDLRVYAWVYAHPQSAPSDIPASISANTIRERKIAYRMRVAFSAVRVM